MTRFLGDARRVRQCGQHRAGARHVATRLLRSMLSGIQPGDPRVLGAVAALLIAVALGATWLPARRAARVQPVEALRVE
jgi:hypothetical protein